jgi:hypothetical protein
MSRRVKHITEIYGARQKGDGGFHSYLGIIGV